MDFSKRHSLPTLFSNAALIEKVTHAAETLLRYFHNPGLNMYYPFHARWQTVEADYGWASTPSDTLEMKKVELQRQYVLAVRNMLAQQRAQTPVTAPGKETFWTGQLWGKEWVPVHVNAYA
jgi:hypothetical protein